MKENRALLAKYYDILEKNRDAKYLNCKFRPVNFNDDASTKSLWKKHKTAIQNIKLSDIEPEKSLLDLKKELSKRIFQNCHFCERRCQTNREEQTGHCGVKQPSISSEFLHLGEENVLVPSYTIFFSGCTFHCVFCQNWDISQRTSGLYIPPRKLANMIEHRKKQGARNVNWVGGDPTPNLYYILQVLKKCKVNIPQVWNSNMYCSSETMELLNEIIDLYLTDFKYGNDQCAQRLSQVENYTKIVKRNHQIAQEQGEMIIRHLVMPNHVECCSKPIIKWISEKLPHAMVNIMSQYRPEYKAHDYKGISKAVTMEEVSMVKEYADEWDIHEI